MKSCLQLLNLDHKLQPAFTVEPAFAVYNLTSYFYVINISAHAQDFTNLVFLESSNDLIKQNKHVVTRVFKIHILY